MAQVKTAVAVVLFAALTAGVGAAYGRSRERQWPDEFPITFGLACMRNGGDPEVCACVAEGVRKRYTPKEFVGFTPELPSIIRSCVGAHEPQDAPAVPDRSF